MSRIDTMVVRNLSEIPYIPTSHKIGTKQVILSNTETGSNVTQIARNILTKGSIVESHVHPSMDEHFLFLEGNGEMTIGEKHIKCIPDMFILVPATVSHTLKANTQLKFITFSVAL